MSTADKAEWDDAIAEYFRLAEDASSNRTPESPAPLRMEWRTWDRKGIARQQNARPPSRLYAEQRQQQAK